MGTCWCGATTRPAARTCDNSDVDECCYHADCSNQSSGGSSLGYNSYYSGYTEDYSSNHGSLAIQDEPWPRRSGRRDAGIGRPNRFSRSVVESEWQWLAWMVGGLVGGLILAAWSPALGFWATMLCGAVAAYRIGSGEIESREVGFWSLLGWFMLLTMFLVFIDARPLDERPFLTGGFAMVLAAFLNPSAAAAGYFGIRVR